MCVRAPMVNTQLIGYNSLDGPTLPSNRHDILDFLFSDRTIHNFIRALAAQAPGIYFTLLHTVFSRVCNQKPNLIIWARFSFIFLLVCVCVFAPLLSCFVRIGVPSIGSALRRSRNDWVFSSLFHSPSSRWTSGCNLIIVCVPRYLHKWYSSIWLAQMSKFESRRRWPRRQTTNRCFISSSIRIFEFDSD